MPYLLINLLILVVMFMATNLFVKNQKTKDVLYIAITCFSVLFFHTFKNWRIMDDIHAYIPAFQYIAKDDSSFDVANNSYYKMQMGYYVLNKLLGYISSSEFYFQFVMGCIISFPYFYLIKKYSPIVWLSCILYFMGFIQSTYVLRVC